MFAFHVILVGPGILIRAGNDGVAKVLSILIGEPLNLRIARHQ